MPLTTQNGSESDIGSGADGSFSARRSKKMASVEPFRVMDVMSRAAELEASGRDVIHLEVGEPDFVTCDIIREAAKEAIDAGHTQYTGALGLPALRSAIAGHYRTTYNVDLAEQQILVTTGASAGLLLLCHLLFEEGDRVLVADPAYPCYRNFLRVVGAQAVAVSGDGSGLLYGEDIQQASASTEDSGALSGVMLASPANPTGSVYTPGALADAVQATRGFSGVVVSDETYHGLVYQPGESGLAETAQVEVKQDQTFVAETAASMIEGQHNDVFVANSFSKYFGMTGWRVGWLVAPEDAVRDLEKLAQNLYIAPPTVSQFAALAAFSPAAMAIHEARRAAFRARRDYLVPALRKLGFTLHGNQQGAFYVYVSIAECLPGWGAQDFATRLLEEEAVALTPGVDFSVHDPHGTLRIAYTCAVERLQEAVARISAFLVRHSL